MLMKKIRSYSALFLLPAIVFTTSCSEEKSNCTISNPAYSYFVDDATDMAADFLRSSGNADSSEIFVPQSYVGPYVQALGLIYDATTIPQRDSVINKAIHKQMNGAKSIIIGILQTNADWAYNWINGTVPTGNATADQLIGDYNLVIESVNYGNAHDFIVIESNNGPINGKALSRLFAPLPGVDFAEPNTYWGPYSNLTCTINGTSAHVVFLEGYGDCPAGCFGYHRWEFDVDLAGCAVTFAGYYP
jgi:hypothetical protein